MTEYYVDSPDENNHDKALQNKKVDFTIIVYRFILILLYKDHVKSAY